MIWAIPLAMAAAGAIQGQQKKEQEKRDRKAEAEIARWTPWTGMQPQRVQAGGGALGGAVTGGLQGASFMQSMNAAGYGKDKDPVANTGESWTGNEMDNASAQPTQPTEIQQPGMKQRPFQNYAQYGTQSPYMRMG